MNANQEKWVELFVRPEPQTAEDIREYVKRLNIWFYLIHMGGFNVDLLMQTL